MTESIVSPEGHSIAECGSGVGHLADGDTLSIIFEVDSLPLLCCEEYGDRSCHDIDIIGVDDEWYDSNTLSSIRNHASSTIDDNFIFYFPAWNF